MKKLNKEQLDLLSYDETMKYRRNFITKSDFDKIDTMEYLDELTVYIEVRFKSETYAMFDRWCKKSNENKERGVNDGLLDFNVGMLKKENGFDVMYYMGLIHNLNKIEDYKYIVGIDTSLPEIYKKMLNWVK